LENSMTINRAVVAVWEITNKMSKYKIGYQVACSRMENYHEP
jgi:hypothetical protein